MKVYLQAEKKPTRRTARTEAKVQSFGHSACAFFLALLTVLLAWVLAGGPAKAAVNEVIPASPFIEVGRTVRPAVVNIRCTRSVTGHGVGTGPLQEMFRQFFPEQEGEGGRFEMPSTGSGFLVDGEGYVLTNHHVIAEAEAIFVRFSGESLEYRADLVGTDPSTDLALLRIDPQGRDLPVLEFGDSDRLEVGAWAVAVGNPFGNLESTMTVGIISAKGRGDLVIGGLTPRYQDFIQTDASINFGNSGGPLVDIHGRVIGVNTAINAQGQGIGFAVPSNMVRHIYAQLREHGRVIRGYLGIRSEDLVRIAGEGDPGLPEGGARVLEVIPGSPAAEAGFLAGDVIVEFGGKAVESQRQLQFLIAGASVGQDVEVKLIRDGDRKGVQVRPVEWIDDGSGAGADTPARWLGLEVASLAEGDPRVQRLKELLGVMAAEGVMVVEVEDGQPAADAGIRQGDVLVSVNGREIPDLETWEELKGMLLHRRDPLSFLVRTGAAENYVSVIPRESGVEN
ncbi:MAG: trypsin-like peptidase domain-containing protein [bacterium]